MKLNGFLLLPKKKTHPSRGDFASVQELRTPDSPRRGWLAGEDEVLPLCDLPLGCSAVITTVAPCVAELMDLGFIPGTRVTPTYSGPGGDPRVYDLEVQEPGQRLLRERDLDRA